MPGEPITNTASNISENCIVILRGKMNTTAENLTSDLSSVNEKLRNELQEQKKLEQALQGKLLHMRTTLDGIEKVLSLLLESRIPT